MDNLLKIANIKEMLINSAEKYGDNVAYKIDDKNITYKEVKNNVDSLGTALINKGLQGKRIAVIGQNSYNWEIAYLSIVCGTGVVVPLDKMLPENELESLIKRSEVEAIFFDEKFEEVLEKISKKNDNNLKLLISMGERKKEKTLLQKDLIETGKQLVLNGNKEFINSKINDDKMNILLFTSGTTSKSKAVMLSHKNICSNIDAIGKTLNVDENDSFLSILPLHHVFECTVGFLFPLSVGARIVFGRGLKHIAQDLKDNQISVLLCVPAIYENLYKNIRKKFEKEGHLELLEELEEKAQNYSMQERRKIFKQIHESIDNNTKLLISGAAALDPEVEKTFRILGFSSRIWFN